VSADGEVILKQLLDEWNAINSSLNRVIAESDAVVHGV